MKRMQFTLILSLMLVIVAVGMLARQSHAGRAQRRKPSRTDGAPKVGEMAPTFKLMSLDGKNETDLASFRGKRPVVLFFGSYT